jgi:transcriptional regulator with XRE-family HTH domain
MQNPEARYSLSPLDADDWEVKFTKSVVRNIARYRDERGITTAELAQACNEIYGEEGKVKASTLNGMFAGKRKSIGVAELLVFAQALNVPPLALVFSTANSSHQLIPSRDQEWQSVRAYDWFIGKMAIGKGNREEFWSISRTIKEIDEADITGSLVDSINAEWVAAQTVGRLVGGNYYRFPEDHLEKEIRRLAEMRQRLREKGIAPPWISPHLDFVDAIPLELPLLPISIGLSADAHARIAARVEKLEKNAVKDNERLAWLKSPEGQAFLSEEKSDYGPASYTD